MKYTPEMVDRIVELHKTGKYLKSEIWEIVGISRQTANRWLKEKSDFCDAFKEAEEERFERLRLDVLGAVHKVVNGYEYDEVMIETNSKGTTRRVTTKFVGPNPSVSFSVAKNLYPERFSEKTEILQRNLNIDSKIDVSKLTDKELDEYERLTRKASANPKGEDTKD